ncbi:MAG: helix-turn-helix transcriptional regulator [Phyllobacterium sp.]
MAEILGDMVYSALLGESTWQHFLDRVADTLPEGKAALVMHDTASKEGFALFSGYEDKATAQYNSHYGKLNPLQPPLAMKPIGVAVNDHELFPREELVKGEFYNDFLVPNGLAYSAGVRIAKAGGQSFTLAIASNRAQPKASKRAIRTLNTVFPHLGRAFSFYRKEAARRETNTSGLHSLTDAVDIAAIVINEERRIRMISKAAEAIVAESSPLRLTADRRVRFGKADVQTVFERMLKRGYDGPAKVDLYLHQVKMTMLQVNKAPESLYFEGPSVLVLLERLDTRPAGHDIQLFADAYRLSRGESRALAGLVDGKSAGQIAEHAGLSKETIRSQIKSLYAKTGAKGEADIIRLLHRRKHD